MKILIVDDLPLNRKLLRVSLEAEGIETCEAADGVEALRVLGKEKADGIISDILMPNMDGYMFCQTVRREEALRELTFIFYTSTYTSPGDEELALACGADLYLRKPAPTAELLLALRSIANRAKARGLAGAQPDESLVMKQYNEALVRKLEERNAELELARTEIAKANEELEQRVSDRTAELLVANQELEAFSHSLAHDLRSPLAVIGGFNELLVEECRGKINDRAMEHLRFISVAARRMNELTNDLLRLARANRGEMSLQRVELSPLALAIFQDLQDTQPARRVEFLHQPGLTASADFGLVRIALENLLGNAWKYTGKTEQARIELGSEKQGDEEVYFVRDNGAGFDLAEAEKLFGTFCRFHPAADFPGTGIGLSTVQRIVSRHHGRIWAKAAPNQGATFYFTLCASKPEFEI